MLRKILVVLGCVACGAMLSAQIPAPGVKIRNLPACASPAGSDLFAAATAGGTTCAETAAQITAGLVPSTRTIFCTAPLLCAGTTSHDLSSNFALSIAIGLTSATVPPGNSTSNGVSGAEYHPDRAPTTGTSASCTDSFVGGAEQGTWRWGNQGSATQSLAQDSNLFTISNETTNLHVRWCTPPAAADWSFAVKSACALSNAASNFGGGIAILEAGSEATPTALSMIGEGGSSASYQTKTSYTSAYSGLTSVTIGAGPAVALPWYYEVRYVNATKAISYWTSGDGMTWFQLNSRTLGAAPSSVGLFLDSNTASNTGLTCRYFYARMLTSITGAIGQ